MTLEEARQHIDRAVIYRTEGQPPEDGVITSVNDAYVFVRYRGWGGSKATRAEDLELANPTV